MFYHHILQAHDGTARTAAEDTLRSSVDTTELAELSHERPTLRIESGGTDYGNADIEMRVSCKIEIREDLRGGRRKHRDPVKFLDDMYRIDDMSRAIRGARCISLNPLFAHRWH